jgi:hypothetical protein
MSRLIVVFFLASLWLASPADAADDVSDIDICRDFSLIAKNVMTARQKKQPMSETLPNTIKQMKDWVKKYGLEMDSKDVEEGAALMVMPAYDIAAYPSDSNWNPERQDAIRDFENMFFEGCYEGLQSD